METTTLSPIAQAVSAAGGVPALAKGCDVSVQAVHKWLKAGRPPAERCIEIERLSGGTITRYQLRPDVFGEQPVGGRRDHLRRQAERRDGDRRKGAN